MKVISIIQRVPNVVLLSQKDGCFSATEFSEIRSAPGCLASASSMDELAEKLDRYYSGQLHAKDFSWNSLSDQPYLVRLSHDHYFTSADVPMVYKGRIRLIGLLPREVSVGAPCSPWARAYLDFYERVITIRDGSKIGSARGIPYFKERP